MITDEEIIDYFIKDNRIIASRSNKRGLKGIPEYKEYLESRFNDSIPFRSYSELIYRIFYKIEERPKCPICGNPLKYVGFKEGYQKYCSYKCALKDPEFIQHKIQSAKETKRRLYGNENYCNSNKIKETKKERYGDPGFNNSDKAKETNLVKYGTTSPLGNKQLRRIGEETKIRRYGDPNYNNREKYVETMVSSYGVHNSYQLPEVRKKIDREKASETKRKNKTFNSSKQEDHLYQILTELYGKNDILRQYKDSERYPWSCDFYIKSLDLFIELQGFFTHGGHPFDKTNYEDLQRKSELEEKWNCTKSKLYIIALNVWCNTDIKKRNLAKDNGLNYIEIFKLNVSKEEVQNLIESYFKGTNSGILI